MGIGPVISQVRRLGGDVLHLCYPATCASCEASAKHGQFLCSACNEQLVGLQHAGRCECCAMPLAEDGMPCPWCEGAGISHFERIIRLGTLSDPLKHLVHRAKYHGKWPIAERLTDALLASGRADRVLAETDVLLPVPLHWWRHIKRGFNQADVIANRIAKRWSRHKLQVVRPVVRLRATDTQTHVHGRAKRAENLRHAFGLIRQKDVTGLRVTIVDDVLTTAATLQSVARTIVPAKPACINAITLAIADPDGRGFEVI